MFGQGRNDWDVGVEFDLARHIDYDQIFVGERIYGLGEEIKII